MFKFGEFHPQAEKEKEKEKERNSNVRARSFDSLKLISQQQQQFRQQQQQQQQQQSDFVRDRSWARAAPSAAFAKATRKFSATEVSTKTYISIGPGKPTRIRENSPSKRTTTTNYQEDIRDAIHQFLSIFLKLRILVLFPVSTMPYVVKI
jgi:transcription initiation factor TFIID subunit TAF12